MISRLILSFTVLQFTSLNCHLSCCCSWMDSKQPISWFPGSIPSFISLQFTSFNCCFSCCCNWMDSKQPISWSPGLISSFTFLPFISFNCCSSCCCSWMDTNPFCDIRLFPFFTFLPLFSSCNSLMDQIPFYDFSQSIPSLPSIYFFPAIDFLIWLFLTLIPITSPWLFPLKLTSDASSHPFDYFSIWFLQLLLDYFLFNWLMHIPYVWWFLDLIPSASARLFPLQLTDTSSLPFDDFSIWFLQLPSILSSAIDWWITSSIWIWRTDVFIRSVMFNLSPLLGADESSR